MLYNIARYRTSPFLTFNETSYVKFPVQQIAGNSGDTLRKI